MTFLPDATHAADLRSWVTAANQSGCDFPIQNLPLAVFSTEQFKKPHIGVAIGDQILDLAACQERGLLRILPDSLQQACGQTTLNALMSLTPQAMRTLRQQLSHLLQASTGPPEGSAQLLIPLTSASFHVPAAIGDYTDFYASLFHATNVGKLFRPDNPLLPNYKHIPIAYHGRSSSIVVSDTPIYRPKGQRAPSSDRTSPQFGPSQQLDYEMEVGLFIRQGNSLGQPISLNRAEDYLFGLCLVNDWSARDLQAWEYRPLGPFLGKSFATSLSPWVVTTEALIPFRCAPFTRSPEDPSPLPYLSSSQNATQGGIDITVQVWLRSAQMKAQGIEPIRLSQANFSQLYWSAAQMITHHTSNGCNLRSGDLLASGTVSGPDSDSWGSLLEITKRGSRPLELPTEEQRGFLIEGDEVILRAYCEKPGFVSIGFGECRGRILANKHFSG